MIPTGGSRDRWISPSSRPACSTQNILRQPGMHSESLSLKQRNKRKTENKRPFPGFLLEEDPWWEGARRILRESRQVMWRKKN